MTMMSAAATVLSDNKNQPMHYMAIWQEIVDRGLFASKGKKPWDTLYAVMWRRPDMFVSLGKGMFRLVVPHEALNGDMLIEIIV